MTVDESIAHVRARQASGAVSTYEVVLADEVGRLRARVAESDSRLTCQNELRAQLEVERLRLAVCGVAARYGDGDGDVLPEYESEALSGVRRLRAVLSRVEALPAKWRAIQPSSMDFREYDVRCAYEAVTADLEEALRGEP